MASTSTHLVSPSSTPKWNYDVFLSFRGEDTRKNFVDHLFAALSQKGIHTFKDDEELRSGEEISPALLKAIEESMFALIVFSKNYASSKWCLDELVKILECKKMMGQRVIPVFYDVDPSEMRKQTGSFESAFEIHEKAFSGNMEKVQTWKTALEEAANITGYSVPDTANGHESKCIQQIIEEIFSKLNHSSPIVADDLVGIESRVEEVESLLHMELDDVRAIGLWGMGGIGKSTIAQAVYDRISHHFEGSCFLANVREFSKKKGLVALQEQLLSKILIGSNIKITSVGRGVNMIKDRLRYRRVLVVIDDVDQLEQLEALTGKLDWFGLGSRIIITTRDEHLLTTYGVTKIYNVKPLKCGEALQLLSWKAFKQSFPSEGYFELSNHIVDYANGLPLALKILGSFLCGREVEKWKSTLRKLHKTPNEKILQVLEISYNGLDKMEKKIFLDIACFFKGKKRDFVTRILDSCDVHPDIGIIVLIQKSLITINSHDQFWMHDLVQEMGWYIVRQEAEVSGKRSRLWLREDVSYVLAENTGTEKVEGIVLEQFEAEDNAFSTAEAFTNMNKLRLLIFHNVLFSRGPAYLSNELNWLDWHAYPSRYLPTSFRAENLVELKMCYSHIVQIWKEIKPLPKLKVINLSHSHRLSSTPDFTVVPNLEQLILEDCTSLLEIHPSLGALKRLVFLNLRDCTNLRKFPSSIHLESLETFILSGCLKLGKFPEILGDMVCLSELYLDRIAIKKLPSSIERLTSLTLMDLSECKNISSLPETICRLRCLKTLKLSGCSKLEELPDNLGNIKCLEELHANNTAIKRLPSSVNLLKDLKVLNLRGCKGTISESSFVSLFSSWFLPRKWEDSVGLVLPSLTGLSSLQRLDLSDCNISVIPSELGNLSSLQLLNLRKNNFVSLPAISRLSQLSILDIDGCKRLEALPELPSSIFHLSAVDCESLISIGDLSTKYYRYLWEISFANCFKLLENKWSENVIDMLLRFALKFAFQGDVFACYRFSMLLPGREIPEWFSYQYFGLEASLQLPPNWYKERILGIAVCVVCDFITKKSPFFISFRLADHNNNSYCVTHESCVMLEGMKVDSGHIWLSYFSNRWLRLPRGKSLKELCRFEVHAYRRNGSPGETLPAREWGVRLVYEKDVIGKDGCGSLGIIEELIGSACFDNVDESYHHSVDESYDNDDESYHHSNYEIYDNDDESYHSDYESPHDTTLYEARGNGSVCSDSDYDHESPHDTTLYEARGNGSVCSNSDYDHESSHDTTLYEAQGNGRVCSDSDDDHDHGLPQHHHHEAQRKDVWVYEESVEDKIIPFKRKRDDDYDHDEAQGVGTKLITNPTPVPESSSDDEPLIKKSKKTLSSLPQADPGTGLQHQPLPDTEGADLPPKVLERSGKSVKDVDPSPTSLLAQPATSATGNVAESPTLVKEKQVQSFSSRPAGGSFSAMKNYLQSLVASVSTDSSSTSANPPVVLTPSAQTFAEAKEALQKIFERDLSDLPSMAPEISALLATINLHGNLSLVMQATIASLQLQLPVMVDSISQATHALSLFEEKFEADMTLGAKIMEIATEFGKLDQLNEELGKEEQRLQAELARVQFARADVTSRADTLLERTDQLALQHTTLKAELPKLQKNKVLAELTLQQNRLCWENMKSKFNAL